MFKSLVFLSLCVFSFGYPYNGYFEENLDASNFRSPVATSLLEEEQLTHIPLQLYYVREPIEYEPTEEMMTLRRRREANPNGDENRRGSVSVGVEHQPKAGTNLNVEGRAKVWESPDRRSQVEANTFYQRHYGGQGGTSRPNYGGGITFTHRF